MARMNREELEKIKQQHKALVTVREGTARASIVVHMGPRGIAAGARPVLAHAAWRTSPELARDVAIDLTGRWRTPLPLRAARTLARRARATQAA